MAVVANGIIYVDGFVVGTVKEINDRPIVREI